MENMDMYRYESIATDLITRPTAVNSVTRTSFETLDLCYLITLIINVKLMNV